MWRRRQVTPRTPERIAKRAAMLPTPDLTMWSDQAINSTGRALTLYNRTKERALLDEAHMGAVAILAIIEEIQRRSE
jgi:hypothetical protein